MYLLFVHISLSKEKCRRRTEVGMSAGVRRNYLLSVAKNLERPAFHQADQDAMRLRFLTRTSFRNDIFYLKRFRYTGALKEEKMNR